MIATSFSRPSARHVLAQAAEELGIVLMEALDKVADADSRPNGLRSTWRTRVALCRAILAVRKVSTLPRLLSMHVAHPQAFIASVSCV